MYTIIDIETTGGSPQQEKITEIAIFVHDGEKIIDEFSTLINPEKTIPYHITGLTGISNEMVANAPKFYEVAKKIIELTDNRVFVAHNANFDYNFIKNEFKNLGYTFSRQQLCTVKLSRKLIPQRRSYSLGNICSDLGISINGRHRAAGDALATVHLFEYLLSLNNYDRNLFQEIAGLTFRGIHPDLDTKTIKELPEQAGIYFFLNDKKEVIYIGKSKNIRNRVISHFSNTSTKKAIEMKENITSIDVEVTGSELIALLLESEEIKNQKPLYNRSQRRAMFNYGLYCFEDEKGYLNLKIKSNAENAEIPMTSFTRKQEGLETLNMLIDKYNLCQKLCHTYNTNGPCFHYQIALCSGACCGEEQPQTYNERVNTALKNFDYDYQNFLIIDTGRRKDEKSVIKIENGKYTGFGYFDIEEAGYYPGIVHDCIKSMRDNREIQQIIKSYLRKNKVEKIVRF